MGVPLPDNVLLATQGWEIVVATLLRTDQPHPTKGRPPRLMLRIEEVLRGSGVDQGQTVQAIWLASGEESFYVMRGGGIEALLRWSEEPLYVPDLGERWIVCLQKPNATPEATAAESCLWIQPRCQYPDSPERRAWIRSCLEKAPPR